jgi:HEAT repeat protein
MSSLESADRVEAADTLPDSGVSPEVVELLMMALSDTDPLVRACAADTIGQIRTEDVRQRIQQCLVVESDSLAKAYLLSSLGAMENAEDLPVLSSALSSSEPLIRFHAAYGLLVSCTAQAVGVIVAGCDDGHWKDRTAAFSALDVATSLFQEMIATAKETAERHRKAAEAGEISAIALEGINSIAKS